MCRAPAVDDLQAMSYVLEAQLDAPSGGYQGAISASGSRIAVGSWSANSVKLYKIDAWNLEATLVYAGA